MATFNLLPPEIQSSEDSDLGDEQMKSVVEESDPGIEYELGNGKIL